MKTFLLTHLLLFSSIFCFAQTWRQKMHNPNLNFYDIQQEFNKEWKNKQYEKGKGYKQFKRWEYFMERRVASDGTFNNSKMLWKEIEKYKKLHYSENRETPVSKWFPLGPDSWTSTGWNPGIGRVNCVEVDPNNENIIYIGTPAGGCWKSIDGGNNWVPLTDNQPILGVSAIEVDPSNSDVIYIGTGDDDAGDTYSFGVLKSTDGGVTWDTTGLVFNNGYKKIYELVIDPNNTNHIMAGTNNGFYNSLDGGVSWSKTLSDNVYDIELNPANSSIIYVAKTSIWKSTDGGQTFLPATNGLPSGGSINRTQLAVTEANPNYVYYLAGDANDDSFYGVYRSTDEASSWQLMANSPNIFSYESDGTGTGGQSWYDMALTASPTNADEIYVGGINVWKSTDGGVTYDISSHWVHPSSIGYTHADIHVLEAFGDKIYCGSDGGIFKSSDAGNNWVDITFGLQITQFYGFGSSEMEPGLIIGGAQDNGTNLWSDSSWTHVIGADGMEALIDWSNPYVMYGTMQNGGLQKSTNGGASFYDISSDMDVESANWVTPFEIDPYNPNVLFAGYENIWKTSNGGNNWTPITNFGGDRIDQIAISPNTSNYIYVGINSTLQMTYDGGTNWVDVTNGLPALDITDIVVDPENQLIVWVTFAGFSDGEKIYKSENAGMTWTNVSGSLPNIPVNCVEAEKGTYNGIYVGMDVGIYYKNDTLNDWIPFYEELPNVIVNELEVNETTGKIRAATYGRGIWDSNMFGKPLIDENSNPNSINEKIVEKRFSVVPNPNNGLFEIKYNRALINENYYIYDLTGHLLMKGKINTTFNSVDLTNYPSGIYLLKIRDENVKISKL